MYFVKVLFYLVGRTLEATEGKTGSLWQTAEEVIRKHSVAFAIVFAYLLNWKILALILMLKLLSSRLQRGAAQKGFVQVALHVVGQTRKVSLSMGIPIFVTRFLSNRQFYFSTKLLHIKNG